MSKHTNATVVPSAPAHRHNPEAGKHTLIGIIRDAFDELGAVREIVSTDLPVIAAHTGMHETTVRLQFYRWRKEGETAVARKHRALALAKRSKGNADAPAQ